MQTKEVFHDRELLSDVFDAAYNAMVGATGHALNRAWDCFNDIDSIVKAAKDGATRARNEMIAIARDKKLIKMRTKRERTHGK